MVKESWRLPDCPKTYPHNDYTDCFACAGSLNEAQRKEAAGELERMAKEQFFGPIREPLPSPKISFVRSTLGGLLPWLRKKEMTKTDTIEKNP